VRTYSFAHGSCPIPSSLFPHMHKPSALLGHSISKISSNQVIHTTTVTQATQPPYQPSHISTHYIRGKYSMGEQPSARGKPSIEGKLFTREKPSWLQHKLVCMNSNPTSPSIHTTTSMYLGHPFLGNANPLWGQPNPMGILPQGTFPFQSINPIIPT
jgi:hypothetical protein